MDTKSTLMFGFCTAICLSMVSVPLFIGINSVKPAFAESTSINTPDTDNSFTSNGSLVTTNTKCYFGIFSSTVRDAYFTFPIPETVSNSIIDSVRIYFYGNKSDETNKFYGIQQEDCPNAESGDPHSWGRTTASVTWTGQLATLWQWTPLITSLFQEWIDDYVHVGTDQFGVVIDDNGASLSSWFADYQYNSSADNVRLYIWYHQQPQVSGRTVLWTKGERTALWSDGTLSAFTDQ